LHGGDWYFMILTWESVCYKTVPYFSSLAAIIGGIRKPI
jgi:hypothetical protein